MCVAVLELLGRSEAGNPIAIDPRSQRNRRSMLQLLKLYLTILNLPYDITNFDGNACELVSDTDDSLFPFVKWDNYTCMSAEKSPMDAQGISSEAGKNHDAH